MNIYKHIPIAQRSAEWYSQRSKSVVTASDFATVLGISPYKSRQQLLREKIDPSLIKEPNEYMKNIFQYGIDNEPRAISDFESFTNYTVEPTGIHTCDYYQNVSCSLDGYIKEINATLEIKTKQSGRLPLEPETHHVIQLISNMEISNSSAGYLSYWTPQASQIFYLERQTDFFRKNIWPAILEFMHLVEIKGNYPRMKSVDKDTLINKINKLF